jgi:hypothetical protein
MIKKITISLSLMLLMIYSSSAIGGVPEKRLWVEATGEAYQGEIETPKEVEARARRDAENKAIEKALGIFIKSHTLVSNSQVAEDLIFASVRGKIKTEQVIEKGWDKGQRELYRVRIKALVEPIYREKDEGIILAASMSKTDLREGDPVKVFYKTNTDCHIYIFSVAVDGSVTLLLPNSATNDNFVLANKAYEFPPKESVMHIKAAFLPKTWGSLVEEKVKVVVTRKREELLALSFQEGMFKVYDASSTGMISDLIKQLNKLDPADWAEATIVYTIAR